MEHGTAISVHKCMRMNQYMVVDYSSPNTAKQMHVGHIRSTIIEDHSRILNSGHKITRIIIGIGSTIWYSLAGCKRKKGIA